MPPLVALLEQHGNTGDALTGRTEFHVLITGLCNNHDGAPTSTVRLSMFGIISAAVPPEDYTPIRGVRIRTLLGLMVADQMIASSLNADEFLSIAGGRERRHRACTEEKRIWLFVRLREIVGHDTVLTDGPTPQLNLDIVSVDILEVDGLIRRAQTAAHQQAFVRALPLIHEALELYNGDVAFPTLYEDFFEAARSDFEYRLRQSILEIGRGVLMMGDATGAEPLLRKAFELLAGRRRDC